MKHILLIFSALLPAVLCPGHVFSGGQDAKLQDYFCEETKKPFFTESPGEKGRFAPQRANAQPDSFLMPKPAGTKRVFVIGESVAALLGAGQAVSDRLPGGNFQGPGAAPSAPRIEIVNCGMGGYESYRIYDILKEVLKYSPDLIVVLSGNNDTKEEVCPGLEGELRRRKFRLLEKYFSISNTGPEARKRALLKMHEAMLSKMGGAAKKAGVPIVFCTLPAAVKDMPPRLQAPLENPYFAKGYRLFYSKKNAEALKNFKLGLAADPRDPFLNFYTAKTLEKLGLASEAAGFYSKAVDYDWTMTRSGRERNDLIRRTAAGQGACVADLEKLFLDMAPRGLTGFAQFTDAMHWNVPHNKAVWDEIFRSAGRCGISGYEKFSAGNPGQWDETLRELALKRLGYAFSWLDERDFSEASLAELSRIGLEEPELLKSAGASPERLKELFADNFWSSLDLKRIEEFFPFFLAHLAETERRSGNYAPALSLYDRALALKPGHPMLKFGRVQVVADMGVKADDVFQSLAKDRFLMGKVRAVAAAYGIKVAAGQSQNRNEASTAEPASPKNAKLSKKISDQAVEKMVANDFKAAEGLFAKALEKNPFNAEALMSLCALRQKDGRTLQALEACQRAAASVYHDPANLIPSLKLLSCDAALESYKILKTLKRGPEGVSALNLCVKNAPPSWAGLDAAKAAIKAP